MAKLTQNEINERLFNEQIGLIQNMNKAQLLTALCNLSYKLKEDSINYPAMFDYNYRILKHAVEAGLTW